MMTIKPNCCDYSVGKADSIYKSGDQQRNGACAR